MFRNVFKEINAKTQNSSYSCFVFYPSKLYVVGKRTLFLHRPFGLQDNLVRNRFVNMDNREKVDVGKTLRALFVIRTVVGKFEVGCIIPPGDPATFPRDSNSFVSNGGRSPRQYPWAVFRRCSSTESLLLSPFF